MDIVPEPISFSRFRAALFDIDGTLIDSLAPLVRGLGDAYVEFGAPRPSDADIQATLGTPLRVQLAMFGLHDEGPEEMKRRADFAIDRFEHYSDLEREFPAAIEALQSACRQGKRVALVTSKSQKELDLLMQRFPAGRLAHATVCSSEVKQPKPNGESALLACQKLGVEPGDAVLIGDSIFDLQCARDAGTAAVGVAYGATTFETLAAESPDLLFETPEQLCNWVAQTDSEPYAKKELTSCQT